MASEQMRYLGVLALLGEAAVHVPEELRDRIDMALEDAVDAIPGLRVSVVLHRRHLWFEPDDPTPAGQGQDAAGQEGGR